MLAFYGYTGKKTKKLHGFEQSIWKTLTDHGKFKYHDHREEDLYIAFSDYKNHSPRLAVDQTNQVYVLATGHLYEWSDGRANSSENELSEEVLKIYLEQGIKPLQSCIGHYSIAIIDKRYAETGKVYLLKDRLGYSPLYFFCDSEGIAFASRAESIGVSGIYKPQLDADALAQALYLGIVLDQKSFFADVRNIDGGQLLEYQNGECRISDPAKPFPWAEQPAARYMDCVDDLADSIKKAMYRLNRYCKKPLRLYLSGGTESRLLLSCLLHQGSDFEAITQYDITPDDDPDVSTVKELQETLQFSLTIEKSETQDAEVTAGMLGEIISDKNNEVHTIVGHGWTTSGDRWNKPIEEKNMAASKQAFGGTSPFKTEFLNGLTSDIQEMSKKTIKKRQNQKWEQKIYGHNMNVYCSTFLRSTETDTHARPQNRFLGNLHLPYLDEESVIATAKIPPMLPSKKIKLFEEVFRRAFPEQLKVPLLHKFESKKCQTVTTRVGNTERYNGKEVLFPFRQLHTVYEKHARKMLKDSSNGLLDRVVSENIQDAPFLPVHFSLGIIFWNSWKKLYFPSF